MKFNWKRILGFAENVGEGFLPGGTEMADAIKAAVAAKGGVEKEKAILAAVLVALNVAEEQFDAKFADEPAFQAGLLQANAGVLLMIKAVQDKSVA